MSLIKLNADSQLKGTLSGQTISTNTTVTQNSYIEQGNPVTINNGVTLTINGPFNAGIYKVFNCVGTGKVVFNADSTIEVYPEWWGAIADGVVGATPSGTDNAIPLQACLTTGKAAKLSGSYLTSVGLNATNSVTNGTIIYSGTGSALTTTGSWSGNIYVYEDAANGLQIIPRAKHTSVGSGDIYSVNHTATNTGKGIYINASTGFIMDINLTQVQVYGFKYGIYGAGGSVAGQTETIINGQGVLLTGSDTPPTGSVGIYINQYFIGSGGKIFGYIESFKTGIVIEDASPSANGVSFYGALEGNTTNWSVPESFPGTLYNDLSGNSLRRSVEAISGRGPWFREIAGAPSPYYMESYYSQKHVVGSYTVPAEFGVYSNSSVPAASFIDGIEPAPLGGFVIDTTYTYSFLEYQKTAWSTAAPTSLSWRAGDVIWNTAPASGGSTPNGWRCITSGTFENYSTTGAITTGTATLTVASATGFSVGMYITIAGVSGIKRINSIVGLVFTLDSNANATVGPTAAVATTDPTFASMGVLP